MLVISIIVTALGLFGFGFSLQRYINSYYYYSDEWGSGYEFDKDWLIVVIISFFILLAGGISIYMAIKKKSDRRIYPLALNLTSLITTFYPLSVILKALAKGKNYDPYYWIWFGVGLAALIGSIVWIVFLRLKTKKANSSNQ
ncbi:MAG: hypothetical protein K5694_03610 [Bacilli bacterium]|nr:hypothetical protein [Bacilli bacterium]